MKKKLTMLQYEFHKGSCVHTKYGSSKLPEFLVFLKITETADFIPALVCQPCGGGVSKFVLQTNASSQEEHEFIGIKLILGSIRNNHDNRHVN